MMVDFFDHDDQETVEFAEANSSPPPGTAS